MKNLQLFNVAPSIPEKLKFLKTLAYNMWWSWDSEAQELIRRIDPDLWKSSGLSPLKFFGMLPPSRLEELSNNEAFMTHYESVKERFEKEVYPLDQERHFTGAKDATAYFSLEFGIHESVRLYSGGLGGLAGDHLKSASDLNVPLIAIGLLYRRGYFQQFLSDDGWQQEHYPIADLHHLPLREALDGDKRQLRVSVNLPEGELHATVWQLDVGRVPLILLDTNIPDNPPEFRDITDKLYGGDRKKRLQQELLLGIGGYRAIRAMGYEPPVCHMNEGHAAFLSLARFQDLTQHYGIEPDAARQIIQHSDVFTTHTPVPAGNEVFDVDLVRPYLDRLSGEIGLTTDEIIRGGQADFGDSGNELSMTILGLRTSLYSNGVSRLHGEVARGMWAHLWPDKPIDEVPIGHVTNGVHVHTWLSSQNEDLLDRYIGPKWRDGQITHDQLQLIDNIPDEELWRAHDIGRARLIRMARESAENQGRVRHDANDHLRAMRSVLNFHGLTVGFARRFATYKRANLLFQDPDRLIRLLTDKDRPLQFIFAGKAHPADDHGKGFIREIIQFARHHGLEDRIVFLENYNIGIARKMVQGVDVWLNNPRRPHEASGTSGMKAAINGGLHASILDGWWDEAYEPGNGFVVGESEVHEDPNYQDHLDAHALYNMLETQMIPTFFDRTDADLPTRWISMMKESMKMSLGFFSSHRMVLEYQHRYYEPAKESFDRLIADQGAAAKGLHDQFQRLCKNWDKVGVDLANVECDISSLNVGDKFEVVAKLELGDLNPDDVVVELYYGPVDSNNTIQTSCSQVMDHAEDLSNGHFAYRQTIECTTTGRYGFTARVKPTGNDWESTLPGLIRWAEKH